MTLNPWKSHTSVLTKTTELPANKASPTLGKQSWRRRAPACRRGSGGLCDAELNPNPSLMPKSNPKLQLTAFFEDYVEGYYDTITKFTPPIPSFFGALSGPLLPASQGAESRGGCHTRIAGANPFQRFRVGCGCKKRVLGPNIL